jgi:hypothetical protein
VITERVKLNAMKIANPRYHQYAGGRSTPLNK